MTQPVFFKFVKKSPTGTGGERISESNADKFFYGLIDLIYGRQEMRKSLAVSGGIFIKREAFFYNFQHLIMGMDSANLHGQPWVTPQSSTQHNPEPFLLFD